MSQQTTGQSSRPEVPQAREALNNMKYEIARELGINLKQGYNGNLTARENGYIGGRMVQKMIQDYQKQHANV